MSQKLFEEADEDFTINLNNSYAKKYDEWREKEEYEKLKAKHGDVASEGTSEDSSDDDDATEITPAVERQFFRALSHLKASSDVIYDPKVEFFQENPSSPSSAPCSKSNSCKPMLLRDYERERLLRGEGLDSDEESGGDKTASLDPSYVEEQEAIRNQLRSALQDSDSENEKSEDDEEYAGFLRKREKTAEEKVKEDEDYKLWLSGQKSSTAEESLKKELEGLRHVWSDPKISKDEEFLRDYILNKRYLEPGDDNYIPHYDELVQDSEPDLSEDEETLQNQAEFEQKFNFRFQEPDQEFIKKYPRTVQESLRKKDERRKNIRQEKRQRQADDRVKRQEEIKRMKAFKKKQMMEKLEKLKETVGHDNLPFDLEELERDFDPEQHERKMKQIFTDDYDYDADPDEEKPVFSDDDEENEIEYWNNWTAEKAREEQEEGGDCEVEESSETPACEDPDFNMDCEFDPCAEQQRHLAEAGGNSSSRKVRRRRGQKRPLAAALARAKPAFDPLTMKLDSYLDQHYRCQDLDLTVPFKYRPVMPNDYGLSAEEVIMADERELNRWASLRRAVQHRGQDEEVSDKKRYKVKARNTEYKKKILPSLFNCDEATEGERSLGQTTKTKSNMADAPSTSESVKHETERNSPQQLTDPVGGVSNCDDDEVGGVKNSEVGGATDCDYDEVGVVKSSDVGGAKKGKHDLGGATECGNEEGRCKEGKGKKNGAKISKRKKNRVKNNEVGGVENGADGLNRITNENVGVGGAKNSGVGGAKNSGVGGASTFMSKSAKHKSNKRSLDANGGQQNRNKKPRLSQGKAAPSSGEARRRPKQQRAQTCEDLTVSAMTDGRLKAFGLNPKKFRNKVKHGQKSS